MRTSANEHEGLDDQVREGVRLLVAALLPGTTTLPPANEVDGYLEYLDLVLAADHELVPPLIELARRVAESGSVDLAVLREASGEVFESGIFALNAAYYIVPEVMRALNYPGQGRRPIAAATPEELVSEALLAPVVARGPVYVPTPDAGE